MQQWEYFFYTIKNSELSPAGQLNIGPLEAIPQLGLEGWELINMAVYELWTILAFKRPKATE